MYKKILIRISILFVSLLSVFGIGHVLFSDSSFIEKHHGNIKVFSADLDHDGEIGEKEKNLTWSESFDKLLEQANNYEKLKEFCNPRQDEHLRKR